MKGWTQQQLAEQLDVTPQAVARIFSVTIDSIIKAQDFGTFVFDFGIGILPYIDMSKADNLIQQVSKYHEIAEFPKIRFKDNTELRDMQYRIILDNVIMADNDLEYVEEKMRIDEMLSYIKLYIN